MFRKHAGFAQNEPNSVFLNIRPENIEEPSARLTGVPATVHPAEPLVMLSLFKLLH